jgi:hypothetical protein
MTKQVLINGSATTLGSTITGLSSMQLGFFKPDGTSIGTGGSTQDFVLYQGAPSGRNPRVSPVVKAGSAKSITKKAGAAPVANVINIGYSGSGSLNINTLTDGQYELKLMNMSQLYPPFVNFTAVIPTETWSAARQIPVEIVFAIQDELNRFLLLNGQVTGGQFAFVTTLCNGASTAIGGSETLTVVNGSNVVTSTGSSHGLVAGDWVRIGSATALTSPVYKVLSVSGATINLASPFVGTSAATVAAGELNAAPSGSTLAGMQIVSTGNWFTTNTWAMGRPNGPLMAIAASDLAGTPVVNTTGFSPGTNTIAQVTGLEYSWLSALGIGNRGTFPYPNDFYTDAAAAQASATTFVVYEINYAPIFSDKSAQSIQRINDLSLYVAIPTGVTVTNFETILAQATGLTLVTL